MTYGPAFLIYGIGLVCGWLACHVELTGVMW